MTLLTTIQQHCLVHGLASPSVVTTSTDAGILQMLAILNELLDSVVDESNHQAYSISGTFVSVATQDQGAITTLVSPSWLWFENGTIFDRTNNQPVLGPLTAEEWQRLQAAAATGPYSSYQIRGNHFYMYPTPSAGHTIGFTYGSSYGVLSSAAVAKQYATADDDTFILPEKILRKGLSFRWKQVKGLPYQADEIAYYKMLNNFIGRDGTKRPYDISLAKSANYDPMHTYAWVPAVPV